MCDFCHKHGEGKKWYLEARHYGEDLLSDLRRRTLIQDFFRYPERLEKDVNSLEKLTRAPGFIRRAVTRRVTKRQQKHHYGQVVPIEDIDRILDFVNSIVRVTCICRHVTLGSEQRYCYGVSMGPNGGEYAQLVRDIDASYLTGPETKGLESLSKSEALKAMHDHEHEGLCHTVWTFETPFIGGICNCDRSDCLAMQTTIKYQVPVMFRAEYVASVHPDLCNGCRQCMRVCQFGAMGYSAANKKIDIDARRCFGCGVCRAVCTKNAISLLDRTSVPVAANLW
jgi:ferredoxin